MSVFLSVDGRPLTDPNLYVSPVSASFEATLANTLKDPDQEKQRHLHASIVDAKKNFKKYQSMDGSNQKRKSVLTAQQVMVTPVQSITSEKSIYQASELMKSFRFRHLPVVSSDGKLEGILSDRDIIRVKNDESVLIRDVMSKVVLTATSESSIRLIADIMLKNRIGAVPIVDSDHRVIGILTTTDILRAIVEKAPIDLWA